MSVTVRSYAENLDEFGLTESTESDTQTCPAKFSEEDGVFTIRYMQKTEGGEYSTSITVADGKMTLLREGAIAGVMEFSEGAVTKTIYSVVPYSFDAEIETKRLRCSLTALGGTLELLYLLTVGGAKKRMRLSITVF